MPVISIIVPVYNAEKYLEQCIESIRSQTFIDFELILVNDGSTDKSTGICNRHAKEDSRILVIHQHNSGVSAARNNGIQEAKGQYICFIDADDIIASDFLSYGISHMQEHEIETAVYGCTKLTDNSTTVAFHYKAPCVFKTEIFLTECYRHLACWGYILSSAIIKRHHIRFEQHLHMSEDIVFMVEYLLKAPDVLTLDKDYYYYRVNPTSVCRRPASLWKAKSQIDAAFCLTQKIKEHAFSQRYQTAMLSITRDLVNSYIYQLSQLSLSKSQRSKAKVCLNDLNSRIREKYNQNLFSPGDKIKYSHLKLYLYFYKSKRNIKSKLKSIIYHTCK